MPNYARVLTIGHVRINPSSPTSTHQTPLMNVQHMANPSNINNHSLHVNNSIGSGLEHTSPFLTHTLKNNQSVYLKNESSQNIIPTQEPGCSSSLPSHDTYPTSSLVPNKHPMLTRGKTGHLKPKTFLVHCEPTTFKHALAQPGWLEAVQQECNSFVSNNT